MLQLRPQRTQSTRSQLFWMSVCLSCLFCMSVSVLSFIYSLSVNSVQKLCEHTAERKYYRPSPCAVGLTPCCPMGAAGGHAHVEGEELKGAEWSIVNCTAFPLQTWVCMVSCFHARISPQVNCFPCKGRGGPEDASKANI